MKSTLKLLDGPTRENSHIVNIVKEFANSMQTLVVALETSCDAQDFEGVAELRRAVRKLIKGSVLTGRKQMSLDNVDIYEVWGDFLEAVHKSRSPKTIGW